MSLADKFNLLNEFNILRIICAVFFIPHIVGKQHAFAAHDRAIERPQCQCALSVK